MSILASVDLGTNTFRMLVARVEGSQLRPLKVERAIVRLGEGMHENRRFSAGAISRAIAALELFKKTADEMGVSRARVVGTSAFRETQNREKLVLDAERITGWRIEVIPGEEEAKLTAKGAFLGLSVPSWPVLLVDIGGGSTEYTVVDRGIIIYTKSTNLGVVHLTEQLVKHDPPTGKELALLRKRIGDTLTELTGRWKPGPLPILVGVAGTPTTIAALHMGLKDYRHDLVHGHTMGLQEVEGLTNRLIAMTTAQRRVLPGMEEGREDLIVAGAILLLESMKAFGSNRLVVSDCGLLEGVLLDMLEEER